MFAAEAQPWIDQNDNYEGYAVNAEKTNGRWAMIGFLVLCASYATTGNLIPGII